MKNAIILHGRPGKEEYYSDDYPSASNSHWLPWLQKQFLMHDVKADTPEVPHAYNPVYELWKTEFERCDVTPDTLLVGHSTGAGFIIRWLSESIVRVGKVFLIAPWLDPRNELDTNMFDFTIDTHLAQKTDGVRVFVSEDDEDGILETVARIEAEVEAVTIRRFSDKGHFCMGDLGTAAFPELLEEVLV